MEHVLPSKLNELKNDIILQFRNWLPEDYDSLPWPARIIDDKDTRINGHESDAVLDSALDKYLKRYKIPNDCYIPFCQACLTNEDPWTLRFTPLPDKDVSAWIKESEYSPTDRSQPDISKVKSSLFLLATQHCVPDNEFLLAARVKIFSWKNDFVLNLWYEKSSRDTTQLLQETRPTTMSGRTFSLDWENWWEPSTQRTLSYGSGGQMRLVNCFPACFPASIWKTKFSWEPLTDNPLIWQFQGQPVVRYERIHGKVDLGDDLARQPLLERWLNELPRGRAREVSKMQSTQ